jgi:hypothetical protein
MTISKKTISAITILALLLLSYCKSYRRNKSFAAVRAINIEKGEALAQKHCQSCHMLPDPSLLDAKSWDEGVLPNMGPLMGIFRHQFRQYPSGRNDRFLDSGFYPEQPLVTPAEWQQIIDYYTATSPDSLPAQLREKEITDGLPLFEVQIPAFTIDPPGTSFVRIADSTLIFADYGTETLYRMSNEFRMMDITPVGGAVVDLNIQQNKLVLCDIGQMNPNNGKYGKLKTVLPDKKGEWKADTTAFIRDLARPVNITVADLNGDSLEDYVTCEFGFMTGSLSWFRNMGNKSFQKNILRPLPGAMQVYVRDHNKDQLPDLWVLFSQGEEGVFVFTNKGNGQFEQKQVLRLPPSYGSTFFELVDFNNDGHEDIVYTCGDNADYSPVLKPYHGMYIFLNDGADRFTQHFFFPINGCYKALARDFDNDGDLDIAAISFFADYARQPGESFVYLDNRQGIFYPSTFRDAIYGRWLTMDAGDLDHDGHIDLVLGNFSKAPATIRSAIDWSQHSSLLFLRNTGRRNN